MPLIKYSRKNVLCMFALPVKTNHNYILIKIVSTNNFIQKRSKLESEYHCKIHLIGIKLIDTKDTEQKLHNLLRLFFPENIEK